jgi:type IV pilus assembly protein PilA
MASTLPDIQEYPAREYTREISAEHRSEEKRMNKRQKGFTLIELLIVVAIILIIAAIAIPNLLRSRMAANEASAVGSVRTINTAEVTYNSSYGVGFSNSLATLGGPAGGVASCTQAELLDPVLSGNGTANDNQKSGYSFIAYSGTVLFTGTLPAGCAAGYVDGYQVAATPLNVGTTGQRAFCSDATGVIQFSTTGVVTEAAPLCGGGLTVLQ